MRRALLPLLCVGLLTAAACAQDAMPLPNPGFEDGLEGWRIEDEGMSTLSTEQAAGGTRSLKVVDADAKLGSNAIATRIPAQGGGSYQLRAKVYPVSGGGLGIYVRALDADGNLAAAGDAFHRGAPTDPKGQWVPFRMDIYTPPNTAFLELWLHSYSHAEVVAYVDDIEFVDFGELEPVPPPWEPQYKLTPKDPLTPADVVGPDGLVYPDWTQTGVRGGIPVVPVATHLREHGGLPDDDRDDAAAILAAVEAAHAQGGGAVLMEAGTYHLDSPIVIRHDDIVLRGAGMDETRVVFRYNLGPDGIRFAEPLDENVYADTVINLHALPENLDRMQIFVGDELIADRRRSAHWGNTFSASVGGGTARGKAEGAERATLKGVATYSDGSQRTVTKDVVFHAGNGDPNDYRRVAGENAIAFSGETRHWRARKIPLTADGKRGDTALAVESTEGLAAGDFIVIDGPATERWKTLTQNACPHGSYRRNILLIDRIEGNTVHLTQPLRIEFPTVDGSYIHRIDPIRNCGIEDMTIEQTENLWITTVSLNGAVDCWARGVRVEMCGRNPVYGYNAKWCTIADCVFDDAWFKGGGGTAYAGWEVSYDCLMTDTDTFKLRHAPLFQWSASGNVIRRGVFTDSDAQWHSGWTNENLIEQCVVIGNTGNGAYGFGAWASPPEDTAHGPNGPRNVVYNCDIRSPKTGLWMGGMNEGWMILYNRFIVESGQGIFAKTFSFDHIIRGNVFALKAESQPMALFLTPDVTGVEVYENRLYGGSGVIAAGVGEVVVERDNEALPYQPEPARPQPPVESIYEWQLANVKR